jgi:hypothetical protein
MWGMKFNAGKCKVMHIGSRNPHYTYTMEEEELTVTDKEKNVEVYVTITLKPGNHCKKAFEKALQASH